METVRRLKRRHRIISEHNIRARRIFSRFSSLFETRPFEPSSPDHKHANEMRVIHDKIWSWRHKPNLISVEREPEQRKQTIDNYVKISSYMVSQGTLERGMHR